MQNGAKFIQKLTTGFKNHMKNLDNFRQAKESPKNWNLMGYFCPKNIFLQLKHCMQRIYLTWLSTTWVKVYQIPCYFWKRKSFFTTQLLFFTSNITYFHLKYPIKKQILKLSSTRIKIHQIPHVIFQTKSQFFFKVWITLQCQER